MADREKIKTCFAQIIVNNSKSKPYYSIMYWENGEMNIGFGSYKLDYVRRWLNEEFEVKRNVDVAPVVHGRWIEKTVPEGRRYFECSNCGAHENKHTAIKGYYCWRCGAKMDGGADND